MGWCCCRGDGDGERKRERKGRRLKERVSERRYDHGSGWGQQAELAGVPEGKVGFRGGRVKWRRGRRKGGNQDVQQEPQASAASKRPSSPPAPLHVLQSPSSA